MTRILLAAGMALSVASCSTTGFSTHESGFRSLAGYTIKKDLDCKCTKLKTKFDPLRDEPRLGFKGFYASL
ncbi:hypothetical protein [Pararhizobium sp. PWRC1-1]|uniref:hypothetical protein n=1 Tax=Pararhizobium sp. PWRC1-1 TaxID=2804566 RepID=UPI003CF7BFC7